jgi:hypothetical protein
MGIKVSLDFSNADTIIAIYFDRSSTSINTDNGKWSRFFSPFIIVTKTKDNRISD